MIICQLNHGFNQIIIDQSKTKQNKKKKQRYKMPN